MKTNQKMIIRNMQKDDIDKVAAAEAASFSDPWTKEDFEYSVEALHDTGLVAVADDIVTGFCIMRQSCEFADIINVAVVPEYRRHGIAGKLIRRIIEEGDALGVTDYTLEVRVSNKAAICLYKNAGFAECFIRKDYYSNPREDALIMTLKKNNSTNYHST